MLIPPKYNLTPEIAELLQSIEASREVIDSITIPVDVENNIRRKTTLKSSLFSARIEGNPLTMEDIHKLPSKDQKKAEAVNILKGINYIKEKSKKDITQKDILKMHEITMKGLIDIDNLGKWRKNMEAIFNSAGIAIYMPPPPNRLPGLITRLLKFTNSDKERFVPIRAALTHYTFERIHPFLDGSGRVGRLLMQKVLIKGEYGMKGLLAIEEYLDNHRSEYYRMLEEPEKDLTEYVAYMLTAIDHTAKEAKKMVLEKRKTDFTDFLLPRRAEIYNIIKDHKLINFNTLQRRFSKINSRTLRYDLKKLQDEGIIIKLGTTKGVYYKPGKI
jgi:Fic family protein